MPKSSWMMERAGKYNSNNNDWKFWQQHNNPIELYDRKIMEQKLDYLHNNPNPGASMVQASPSANHT